jgi:hypothetical protein
MSMHLFVWSLRRRLAIMARHIGLVGCVLGLLAPLLALAFALESHLQAELAREHAAAVQLHAQAAMLKPTQPAAMSLEQELRLFQAQLPAAEDRMQILADLFDLAEKHRLVLARGEYRLIPEDKSGLSSFRITLPIKGDPGVIGRFVQEALQTNPALAFEALTLKRENLNHDLVEAKLQLILFMRGSGVAPPRNSPATAGRSS